MLIDRKFKTDAAFGYIATGGKMAVAFLFMLTVTHYGSVAIYGALMLLVSLSTVMGSVVSLRTNEALVAFYKHGEATEDWGRCKFAIVAGVLLDMLVGAVLLAVVHLSDKAIASHLLKDSGASGEVRLYGYAMVAASMRSTPVAYLQATERITVANMIALAEQLAKLAIALALALSSHQLSLRMVVLAAVVPALAATVVFCTPLVMALVRRFRDVALSRDRELVRDYARFSVKTFASSTLKAGNKNFDTVVLGYLSDTTSVGIYATLRQLTFPLTFLSSPLEAVAFPRLVTAVAQRRHADLRQMIATVNRALLRASGVAILLLVPVAALYPHVADLRLGAVAYVTLSVIALTAVLRSQLWWTRPFSSAVNPNLSVAANLAATGFLLIVLYPLTAALDFAGTAIAMLALSVLMSMYWTRVRTRHV